MTYRARTVAENGEKDAFSVISDNEWNPYSAIISNCKIFCKFVGYEKEIYFTEFGLTIIDIYGN